jgi:hypothetical protein
MRGRMLVRKPGYEPELDAEPWVGGRSRFLSGVGGRAPLV